MEARRECWWSLWWRGQQVTDIKDAQMQKPKTGRRAGGAVTCNPQYRSLLAAAGRLVTLFVYTSVARAFRGRVEEFFEPRTHG